MTCDPLHSLSKKLLDEQILILEKVKLSLPLPVEMMIRLSLMLLALVSSHSFLESLKLTFGENKLQFNFSLAKAN